ncbi:TPA: glyoxalase/bleomycin resistance/dioxygenase family protein, partial [Vibrio vulnificus]|nr:glyoxalase/bleomycin resistance/dioxygenase family protein [Vibrio vulnificus]HDZ3272055.1 glyoxalase/bleomycin resistance/dioxygenase family protein [Vibrio vulnificus]
MTPVAVLVYVPDVEVGLQWYQQAFPEAVQMHLPDFDFTVLDVNGFSIEIVQSDDKVSEGKKGTVLYWSVRDLSVEISRFE